MAGIIILSILYILHNPVKLSPTVREKTDVNPVTINPSIDIQIKDTDHCTEVDLRILVITYNRPKSLNRLLESLNRADYMDDKVCIEVWIDRSKQGIIHESTYATAINFKFKKGQINVINQKRHAGIYGQWMGTWQPSVETEEISVILEDDLEVSQFFYRYLRHVHKKYDSDKKVNGYSLHCSIKHGNGASGYVQAPEESSVFTYPIIGTWGFSPKKSNWVNFTNWYKSVYMNNTFYPFVPGIMPTSWYKTFIKTGTTDSMWEMWHIFYAWNHREVTLYPSLKKCNGFTVNWREIGLHFKVKHNMNDKLITQWDSRYEYESLPDKPVHLNVFGQKMSPVLDVMSITI